MEKRIKRLVLILNLILICGYILILLGIVVLIFSKSTSINAWFSMIPFAIGLSSLWSIEFLKLNFSKKV